MHAIKCSDKYQLGIFHVSKIMENSIINSKIFILLCLGFSLLLSAKVDAQKNSVGFGLGGLTYTGDLVEGYQWNDNRPAGTVFYKWHFSPYISARLGGTVGMLKASDDNRDIQSQNRAASFSAWVFEAAGVMEYQFFDLEDKYRPYNWSPYVFTGVAYAYISGEDDRETDYRLGALSIPIGAGIRFPLNRKWKMDVEFGARRTFEDGIDNIIASPPNKNARGGNPNFKDWYYFTGVTFTYTIFRPSCPGGPPFY
jgi:hypothetical protein